MLMIDGDPQGNLTLFFGARGKKDFGNLLLSLLEKKAIKPIEYINTNVRRNLDILPAKNKNLKIDMQDANILQASKAFSVLYWFDEIALRLDIDRLFAVKQSS